MGRCRHAGQTALSTSWRTGRAGGRWRASTRRSACCARAAPAPWVARPTRARRRPRPRHAASCRTATRPSPPAARVSSAAALGAGGGNQCGLRSSSAGGCAWLAFDLQDRVDLQVRVALDVEVHRRAHGGQRSERSVALLVAEVGDGRSDHGPLLAPSAVVGHRTDEVLQREQEGAARRRPPEAAVSPPVCVECGMQLAEHPVQGDDGLTQSINFALRSSDPRNHGGGGELLLLLRVLQRVLRLYKLRKPLARARRSLLYGLR